MPIGSGNASLARKIATRKERNRAIWVGLLVFVVFALIAGALWIGLPNRLASVDANFQQAVRLGLPTRASEISPPPESGDAFLDLVVLHKDFTLVKDQYYDLLRKSKRHAVGGPPRSSAEDKVRKREFLTTYSSLNDRFLEICEAENLHFPIDYSDLEYEYSEFFTVSGMVDGLVVSTQFDIITRDVVSAERKLIALNNLADMLYESADTVIINRGDGIKGQVIQLILQLIEQDPKRSRYYASLLTIDHRRMMAIGRSFRERCYYRGALIQSLPSRTIIDYLATGKEPVIPSEPVPELRPPSEPLNRMYAARLYSNQAILLTLFNTDGSPKSLKSLIMSNELLYKRLDYSNLPAEEWLSGVDDIYLTPFLRLHRNMVALKVIADHVESGSLPTEPIIDPLTEKQIRFEQVGEFLVAYEDSQQITSKVDIPDIWMADFRSFLVYPSGRQDEFEALIKDRLAEALTTERRLRNSVRASRH